MTSEEVYYSIALTRMTGFNAGMALRLCQAMGCAQAVYEHRRDIGDAVADTTPSAAPSHAALGRRPAAGSS